MKKIIPIIIALVSATSVQAFDFRKFPPCTGLGVHNIHVSAEAQGDWIDPITGFQFSVDQSGVATIVGPLYSNLLQYVRLNNPQVGPILDESDLISEKFCLENSLSKSGGFEILTSRIRTWRLGIPPVLASNTYAYTIELRRNLSTNKREVRAGDYTLTWGYMVIPLGGYNDPSPWAEIARDQD